MGKLERLRNLRLRLDLITFVVLSILLFVVSSRLPKPILADACFIAALTVKVIGLPAKIAKIKKDGSVAGVSLLGNALDYQSYVLWGFYGLAIHSPVLFWGQFPGAALVFALTWLNLHHGSFPWRRKPNKLGHYDVQDCRACRFVDLRGREILDPKSPLFEKIGRTTSWFESKSKHHVPDGASEWPRPCNGPGCPGEQHAMLAFARSDELGAISLRPGLRVECNTCSRRTNHMPSVHPRSNECCWWDSHDLAARKINEANARRRFAQVGSAG